MVGSRQVNRWWGTTRALMRAYGLEVLQYRAQAFIWALTDIIGSVVMLVVMLAAGAGKPVAGYSPSDFALYFISLVAVALLVTSHMQWEIGQEIKDGAVSTLMLRPASWVWTMYIRNFVWRVLRTAFFVPGLAICIFAFSGLLQNATPHFGIEFFLALFLGLNVSFVTVICLGTIAFFVDDAFAIFEVYYLPMLFLSGQIFPIALLPDWAQIIGKLLPFYYTTAVPVEVLCGRLQGQAAWLAILGQVVWIFLGLAIYRYSWKAGARRYSGTGM